MQNRNLHFCWQWRQFYSVEMCLHPSLFLLYMNLWISKRNISVETFGNLYHLKWSTSALSLLGAQLISYKLQVVHTVAWSRDLNYTGEREQLHISLYRIAACVRDYLFADVIASPVRKLTSDRRLELHLSTTRSPNRSWPSISLGRWRR